MKAPLFALVLALPLPLFAANAGEALLLKGGTVTMEGQRMVATDGATVIGRNDEPRVTADRIVFDRDRATFTFTGHVVIQAGGATFETNEATLSTQGKKVMALSGGQITLGGTQPADSGASEQKAQGFFEPYPKTDTRLPGSR